jgi:hypothetical protein
MPQYFSCADNNAKDGDGGKMGKNAKDGGGGKMGGNATDLRIKVDTPSLTQQ